MEKDRRGTFRQRFFIDLRAGETNVISWKKLLNKRVVTSTVEEPQAQTQDCIGDSKLQKSDLPSPGNRFSAVIERIEHLYRGDSSSDEEKLDDVPDDDRYDTEDSFIDDEELDEYFSIEKSKTKHSGFFINRGKLERVNEPAPSLVRAPKKLKKKCIKKTPVDRCIEKMPEKLPKAHGTGTTKQRKKLLSSAPKEDSIGRPKDSMLERSFQELEKSVAELYPTMMNIQEKDRSSQGAKRRLPALVKQKLAKVAILAMNQGKLSNKLIDRLVNIIGHTIQLKILKRNFKEIIELGKSAKERKEKIQDIRREGTELIKMQLKSKVLERLEDSLDDFQSISISAVKESSSVPFKWDNATEDFLCEVYDQYLKGIGGNKGPQIKELFVEGIGGKKGPQINELFVEDVEKAKKKKDSLKTKMDVWNEDWNVSKGSNVNLETLAPYDKQIELERTHGVYVVGGNNLQCKEAKSKLPSITGKKRKYVNSSRKEFKNNNRQPLYTRKI